MQSAINKIRRGPKLETIVKVVVLSSLSFHLMIIYELNLRKIFTAEDFYKNLDAEFVDKKNFGETYGYSSDSDRKNEPNFT